MSKFIEFISPEGEVVQYRPLSDRLPEFLKAYPPKEGFRVEIDYLDPIEVKPGLRRLYEAAIAAGKSMEEAGLPPIASGTIIFRARLIDPDGRVVQTASALRPIQSYKDWEKGETAARQRLLAALGFGGEVFDIDEAGDRQDQGLVTLGPHGPSGGESAFPAPRSPQPETGEPKAQAPQPEGGGEAIPAALLRQIEHQAKLKGRPAPEVNSVDEAKRALKELLQA